MKKSFAEIIVAHARAALALHDQLGTINRVVDMITTALKSGHSVYICGNGGSAADANHFAGELSGRFYIQQREGLSVFSLVSNSSTLTAIANDFGYEFVFSRQVNAHAKKHDVVIGITTSGRSKNIINALEAGKRIGCITIGLTGTYSEQLVSVSDSIISADSSDTPRIQEMHTFILHIIAESVEDKCFSKRYLLEDAESSVQRILPVAQ